MDINTGDLGRRLLTEAKKKSEDGKIDYKSNLLMGLKTDKKFTVESMF